jgi:signal transduction histidine kinase
MSTMKISNSDPASYAPVPQSSDQDHGGHTVQFYRDDSFLLDELGRFIGSALEAGDAGIVIARRYHRNGIEQRLALRGLDISSAIAQGRYVPLDAAETLSKFMHEGFPDEDCFEEIIGELIARASAAAEGNCRRVVAFGEMVALLWEDGKSDAAIRLEQLWSHLAQTHSFSLRCAYPMTSFHREEHEEVFLKICAEHSGVIPSDGYTVLASNEERLRKIAHLQLRDGVFKALQTTKRQLMKEIAEKSEMERKLQDSERSLRELSGRILRMQDEERRHLGRELHDSVGQYLAVLKMGLELLKSEVGSIGAGVDQQLADCLGLAEQSMAEVRTMSYLLYPPMLEEMGLKIAIPWYLDGFAKRSGIQTTFEIADALGRLPREVELVMFRVLQESLTNVHRHSGSPTAHVGVKIQGGAVSVEISDKGRGIFSAVLESTRIALGTMGVGLRGMSERVRELGGKLELFATEEGSTVVATVPCQELVGVQLGLGGDSHCPSEF